MVADDSDVNKIIVAEINHKRASDNQDCEQDENPKNYIINDYRPTSGTVHKVKVYKWVENKSIAENLTDFLTSLCFNIDTKYVDVDQLVRKTMESMAANATFDQYRIHCADVAASMTYIHYDYALLAGRVLTNNIHENVPHNFMISSMLLYFEKLISLSYMQLVSKYHKKIVEVIKNDRDYNYKYFGMKTLMNGYLLKHNNRVVERPQHMLMRVALTIHGEDLARVFETYQLMSLGMFTHASPTIFAAGTDREQMCSCFLQCIKEDSIDGIYKTLHESALISKLGGGIGLSVQNVSAHRGGNSTKSGGLVPMLRVFNNMVRHVDQGGKRKGALAAYVEPWHADIYDVLNLKRNMGSEDGKARDIMLGLWVPDLFMKRVERDEKWSLFCPSKCPKLVDQYGLNFEDQYQQYENAAMYERQVMARDLFRFIVETNVETGGPYMLYKDACNRYSNQKHLGTINCSNLCAEIVQYSDKDETAVCNLASIAVNKCVNVKDKKFDYGLLKSLTKVVVRNLNKIIDVNHYPTTETMINNKKHRPIGVGIQGLADAFVLLGLPYDSVEARAVNRLIAETIYFGALDASCELAEVDGPYESYENSPTSKDLLHFQLYKDSNVNNDDTENFDEFWPSSLWKWDELRSRIKLYGLRNSLLVAYMPTATTAQILGNNESFEPFTSNVYLRRVLAGEFQVVNEHLIKKLIELNIYTPQVRNKILSENGSIQNINEIPQHVKDLFKTAWEIKSKCIINMAADRAPFIDQSQSLNLFVADPTYSMMTSIHFYGWQKKLKTGMYYLRTKPAAQATKVTVNSIITSSTSASSTPQPPLCDRKRKLNYDNDEYEDDDDDDDDDDSGCAHCHA
ncbi:large ribonucleotide reductase 1 [Alphabaculovirus altersperidaniae]|uniref:Ribonucleoside-diphosphate reductase n=1 Tax=Spodoptera eridania nucleopolyhedrovirus TaxID=2315721 RepID=A0ABX6TQ97_9ABAC|nr:large ribonucleotide reductase 1 [Spodoptera eridania nucleopolyhedrovirus]QNV47916.1 large ribonucleotide reductase 1 [Spodoptera eridania nucleopolyhedrovirus]